MSPSEPPPPVVNIILCQQKSSQSFSSHPVFIHLQQASFADQFVQFSILEPCKLDCIHWDLKSRESLDLSGNSFMVERKLTRREPK
jgi:hypothetical protein